MRPAHTRLPDSIFAPLERELTHKQRRFVEGYLRNGGKHVAAAIEAGYAESTADNASAALLRNPMISKAIQIEIVKTLGLHAIPALHRVRELVDHAKSDYVKLEAARDLLDRAGFGKPERAGWQGDNALNVQLNLTVEGGSKTQLITDSDHPDMRKTALEFDHQPEAGGAGATRPVGDDASHGYRTRARESCKEAVVQADEVVVFDGEYVDLSEIPHFLGRKIDNGG